MFISAIISAITSGIVSLAVFKFKEHSKAKENNRITGQAIVNYAIINLSFDLKRLNQAINSNCDNELVYFPLVDKLNRSDFDRRFHRFQILPYISAIFV